MEHAAAVALLRELLSGGLLVTGRSSGFCVMCVRCGAQAVSASGLEYACGSQEGMLPSFSSEAHRGLPAACARRSAKEKCNSFASGGGQQLTGERSDVFWDSSGSPKLHASCCSSGRGDADIPPPSPTLEGASVGSASASPAVLAAPDDFFEEDNPKGAAGYQKRGARECLSVLIARGTHSAQEGNAALRMKTSIERLYDASLVSIQSAVSSSLREDPRVTVARGWKCRMVANDMEEERICELASLSFASTSRTTTAATSRSDQSSTFPPARVLSPLLSAGDVCKSKRLGASLLLGAVPVGLLPHSP
ncbi:hypothetical protein Emag_001294 [Eimeria magna]